MSDEEYTYSDEEEEYVYSDSDIAGQNMRLTSPGTGASTSENRAAARSKGPGPEYRIVNMEELLQEQRALINEISGILELDFSTAGILLRQFRWNKEKLFEEYCANPEETCKKSGVEFLGQLAAPLPAGATITCEICCEDYAQDSVLGVGCDHRFCTECWRPYLAHKIAEGPLCVDATCPAHGCNIIVREEVFKALVSPEDYARYAKYSLRSYVDINKSVKWCPAPGCDNAILGTGGCPMVRCSCGCQFCMRCGEEDHLPVTCDHLTLWQEKCKNESETANWILANTKKCPKCSVRIEKNQGCNHMVCRHCKFEFCWVCLGAWGDHGTNTGGYYKCNRYEPGGETDDSDAAKAKAELDRYLHYYQRYMNHSEAGKYAVKMRSSTERRMVELQEASSNSSWIDVQFLKTATEQLIECRRVLKYTYVFAYYLPKGKEKNLFEYLQENLEKNTEHLTGLSELPLDQMDRSEVINFTRVTENFLFNLLAGVEDGLTSG